MSAQMIRKAVIPAAGWGTRFLPATKSIPKEMIPIIDVPMIQYIVEEAVRAGIREVVLVTYRNKEAIENHFDYHHELQDHLDEKEKKDLAEVSRSLGRLCNLIAIRQKQSLGLGHAVLCAEPVVGKEPFAVLLGDDLVDSPVPCIGQLIEVAEQQRASVVGVMEVDPSEVFKYGIVGGRFLNPRLMEVNQLVEKPAVGQAPSCLAIPGRYVLSPQIFESLRKTKPGKLGEIQLTDALQHGVDAQATTGERLLAYQFDGVRYDTGDRLGYLDATLAFALKRPELAQGVKELMRKHLEQQERGL
ncbi:MAG: UTP--glucose-1-phosphate uridylyltransferase GalU [Bdellovibrionia bacterium]